MITSEIEKLVENDILNAGELPEEGIVAGQFVASLFYKHLNLPLNRPLNDIDIFVDQKLELATNHAFRTFRCNKRMISKQASNFKDNIRSAFFRGYSIIRSYMVENETNTVPINIIVTSPTYFIDSFDFTQYIQKNHVISNKLKKDMMEKTKDLTPEMLINNFDLNCCAVAYNIKTKTFHYTDAFLNFLTDSKLRITSAHSPHSTLLRLYKKVRELDCNPDINDELNFISIYITMFPKYTSPSLIKFKYGTRYLEQYNKEKNETIENIIEFNNNQTVSIKNNFHSIVKNEDGFETLHDIYQNMSFIKDLDQRIVSLNFLLNIYYSSIGVLEDGKDNLRYIRELTKKRENSLETDSLAFHWFLKKVDWQPFGSYNIDKIEKQLTNTLVIERDAHLIFSLIPYFEEPSDMETFSNYFIDENGNYDKVKGEFFKYHNKDIYELKDIDFNIKKYSPKMIFPFIYSICNKKQALSVDIESNFSLQTYFQNEDKEKTIFLFKIGKLVSIPFFFGKNKHAVKEGTFFFGSNGSDKQIKWKSLNFDDIFKNIYFIDGNDEETYVRTHDAKKTFKLFFIATVLLLMYFTNTESADKATRKQLFKERFQTIKDNFTSNLRNNKRVSKVYPTKLISKMREYFMI